MKSSGPSQLGIVMQRGGMIRRPSSAKHKSDVASPVSGTNVTKALTTKIFIKGLEVKAECGVYAYEKGRRRTLMVDVEVLVGPDVRASTDELEQTVDYDTLAAHIHDVANAAHLHLIETFAEQVCALILTNPRIECVRLRVEKPGSVPNAICSGVEIERTR